MDILVNKKQYSVLNEAFSFSDKYAMFIRNQLEKIYKPLGLWGKAPNPNNDCETGVGVIKIFPHSDYDVWSVLNRFDTNLKVKKKLYELYEESSSGDFSEHNFLKWIESNRNELFGPDGKHTQSLVNLNMDTIISGNKNEEYSVKILSDRFPNATIKRYCAGDIRDTRKGIDVTISNGSKDFNVQIKPFKKVGSYVDDDGDTFFEVNSYLEVNKYSQRNVQIFMFVSVETNEYILFANKKNKIGQMRGNVIRFYEPPLYTNMSFVTKQKRKYKNEDDTNVFFGQEKETLKNLYFRKSELEKLISQHEKLTNNNDNSNSNERDTGTV